MKLLDIMGYNSSVYAEYASALRKSAAIHHQSRKQGEKLPETPPHTFSLSQAIEKLWLSLKDLLSSFSSRITQPTHNKQPTFYTYPSPIKTEKPTNNNIPPIPTHQPTHQEDDLRCETILNEIQTLRTPLSPDTFKRNFFLRLSTSEQKHIMDRVTEVISTSTDDELREMTQAVINRDWKHDSFKTGNWIAVAVKLFEQGFLDDFEMAHLFLYDSCRDSPDFEYHNTNTDSTWEQILTQAFSAASGLRIQSGLPSLESKLPRKDLEVFSYKITPKERHEENQQIGDFCKLFFMPTIQGTKSSPGLTHEDFTLLPLVGIGSSVSYWLEAVAA